MSRLRLRIARAGSLLVVFLFSLSVRLLCQELTPEEILSRVEDLFKDIEDYSVEVVANVDMPGLRAPEMRARVYYKSPDKIHVESDGFSILPREGIASDPERFEERYAPQLVGEEHFQGKPVYRLRLVPIKEFKRELEVILLVDKEKFVVWRIQKLYEDDPFLTVDFEYTLVDGHFLLPSKSIVELVLARMPEREMESYFPGPGDESVESLFPDKEGSAPKHGYATVRFERYQVNIGLPDSLFAEEKQKKGRNQRK